MSQLVHCTEYLHPTCFAGLDPRRPATANEMDFYLGELHRDLEACQTRTDDLSENDSMLLDVVRQLRGALRGALRDFSVKIPHSSYSRDGVQYGRLIGDPLLDQIGDTLPLLVADPHLRSHTRILLRMLELRVGLRNTLGGHEDLRELLTHWEGQNLSMGDLKGVSRRVYSAIGNIVYRHREDYAVLPDEARVPEAYRQIGQWACDQLGKPLDFHFAYRSSAEAANRTPALRVIQGGQA